MAGLETAKIGFAGRRVDRFGIGTTPRLRMNEERIRVGTRAGLIASTGEFWVNGGSRKHLKELRSGGRGGGNPCALPG